MPETAVSAPGKPAWADLSTTDAAAGKTFYSKLFGWQPEDQGPEAGGQLVFQLRGKAGAALGPAPNPGQPHRRAGDTPAHDPAPTGEKAPGGGGGRAPGAEGALGGTAG